MKRTVNRIRNADFSEGKAGPRGWVWTATDRAVRWERGHESCTPAGPAFHHATPRQVLPARRAGRGPGEEATAHRAHAAGPVMTIHSEGAESSGTWWQTISCKPKTFYRVEATVTCELIPPADLGDPTRAGLMLYVEAREEQSRRGQAPTLQRRTTPGLHRTMEPTAVRTYYRVPEGIRRLRIGVGVVHAGGWATIHHVRLIEILEPEETSHILAIPPPGYAQPAPRRARSVCVCSATAEARTVTQLLRDAFGHSGVTTIEPRELHADGDNAIPADALLLPDERPPPTLRSLTRLLRFAERHIVVISLPAFAEIGGHALRLRRVEQDDDPIGAMISFGNYATRGFALHDVIPYAWPGKAPGSFVQNQFRKTTELKNFCKRHGFASLLESVCDQDVTSYRPVCLYKETSGGGLFVLDIEPAEAPATTFAEPALAMHFLLSVLGRAQCNLGQYVVPERAESDFRALIRDMPDRFESCALREPDLPIEEVTDQILTVGGEDRSYGLDLSKRPLIVVRSGLIPGDVESVYGAFAWFKQLVRMEPFPCPYARNLVSRFRLAWVPAVAPWPARDGWRRGDVSPDVYRDGSRYASGEIDTPACFSTDDEVSLLIDLASVPQNTARVLFSGRDRQMYAHLATWLPQLASALPAGRYFLPSVGEEEHFCDRSRISWRYVKYDTRVIVAPDRFESPWSQTVLASGGNVIRIEVPGCDADFSAHSIQRTDLTATLLEHVVGLRYGLIAVNRTAERVQLDRLSPLEPGESYVLDRNDVLLRGTASQAG